MQLLREFDLVFFDQRLAGGLALGLEERVGHRAADQQLVDDLQQVLNHFDLVGDFRAAENRDAGALGIAWWPCRGIRVPCPSAGRRRPSDERIMPTVEACARCAEPKASLT